MTVPYSFQLQDVRKLHQWKGRALVAWDPGLGKTFLSLFFHYRHPVIRPTIVVCPASIKWNWQREAAHHFGVRAEVLCGTRPPKEHLLQPPEILIINYDILHAWVKWLRRLRPQLIVLDECQNLRGRGTRRTRAARLLCCGANATQWHAPHVLALGGTGGMENRPAEMWPTLNILRPDLFPNFLEFAFEWCGPKRAPWGWEFKGSTNPEGLHKYLCEHVMIRRRKVDVLHQLPKKRRMVIVLDVGEGRKEYLAVLQDFKKWAARNLSKQKQRQAGKAEALVKLNYLKTLAAQMKMDSVIQWIEDYLEESGGKLIVFAIHRKIVKRLHEHWKDRSVIVTGAVIGKKRQQAFDLFLHDKHIKLLIGNIKAAGVGWSAKGVQACAFVEMSWIPAEHLQGEDRTHGIKRGKVGAASEAYYLIARDTIEVDICRSIQQKSKTLGKILDGHKVKESLDVYRQVCQSILKGESYGTELDRNKRPSTTK